MIQCLLCTGCVFAAMLHTTIHVDGIMFYIKPNLLKGPNLGNFNKNDINFSGQVQAANEVCVAQNTTA